MPYKNNKEKAKEYNKKYRQENIEKYKEYKKKWYQENKEEIKEYKKKWLKENKEKWKKYSREYQSLRRKIDPLFRLNYSISSGINTSLKGKKSGRKWETLVGYTIEDLINHLESKFESWMNWDNWGKANINKRTWNIDHIKPVSLFNYETAEDPEFRKCWSLENLQPLEAIENIKKYNKYKIE